MTDDYERIPCPKCGRKPKTATRFKKHRRRWSGKCKPAPGMV